MLDLPKNKPISTPFLLPKKQRLKRQTQETVVGWVLFNVSGINISGWQQVEYFKEVSQVEGLISNSAKKTNCSSTRWINFLTTNFQKKWKKFTNRNVVPSKCCSNELYLPLMVFFSGQVRTGPLDRDFSPSIIPFVPKVPIHSCLSRRTTQHHHDPWVE